MKKRVLLVLFLLVFLFVFSRCSIAREINEDIEDVEEFSSSFLFVETSNIDTIMSDEKIENVTEVASDIYVVEYINDTAAKEGFLKLNEDENVDNVFEDIEITSLDEDIDLEAYAVNPSYRAWGVESTGMDNYTTYLKNNGNNNQVLIAVLDTGISEQHEVFTTTNTSDRVRMDLAHNYIDPDVNEQIDVNDVEDDNGHGTMVSSVIAESTPSNVKIVPLKILRGNGRGSLADTVTALIAIKDKVDIINMSLGIEEKDITQDQKEAVDKIIAEIYDNGNGPLMVCASGNSGANAVSFPASSAYTLGVSALYKTTNGVGWANFSDYGDEIDFSAPGYDLILASHSHPNGYVYECSGTSAATPFVSSALALLKTEYPNKTPNELVEILKENVVDLGAAGKDPYYGYGSINFNVNMFNEPKVSKSSVTITNNECTVVSNCVCSDNVIKYAYKKVGQSVQDADWIAVPEIKKNVQITFKVKENGNYNIYYLDDDGDVGIGAFTVEGIGQNVQTDIPVSSIKLNKTNVIMDKGKTTTLTATVSPTNATNKNVTWTSSNTSVATIDKNGKITAKAAGTSTITAKAGDKKATCTVTVNAKKPSVKYRTHVQYVGWQGYVYDGAMSGTSGQSLRLEGINISLNSPDISGGIEYRTHVQNIGWQNYVSNGTMSGTSGQGLRLEAIQIRLTGDISKQYDVYYRVHCQNFGWLGWAKNGQESGSAGYGYRLEGIQIKLVKKGDAAPGSTANYFHKAPLAVNYRTHVQYVGWQDYVSNGAMSGTSGQALRLEGIEIFLSNTPTTGGVEYATHVQNIGWQGFVKDGAMSGTSGQALRLEGIKIRLTGDMANQYDIYYRVHCQNIGWLGWAKNGQESGSSGYGYRLEGIEIRLVKKGGAAPGSTANCFYKYVAPTTYSSAASNSQSDGNYIGNKNSHVFHRMQCPAVSNMKESNKNYFYNTTREDMIRRGYKACKDCRP